MQQRILMLCKAFPPVTGGVETYSEQVAAAYLRQGADVTVLTQTEGPVGWQTRILPDGPVELFNTGPGSQAAVALKLAREVAGVTRRNSFDFAHATTWRPALTLAAGRRVPTRVVTVHGREVMNFPRFVRAGLRRVLRSYEVVVAVSNATREVAIAALGGAAPLGTWVVASNGLSYPDRAARFERPPAGSRTLNLFTLARLVPRKNVEGCLRALGALHRQGVSNFYYRIGGTGSEQERLKQTVAELGLEQHVEFLGYVAEEDIPGLYETADIFLHPQTNSGEGNDFEGFGIVIADAMSFGCAVIAGANGGPSDFVVSGHNGYLVDGERPHEIEDALQLLLTDSRVREDLGGTARADSLRTLSWDLHATSILRLI